jgi:Tc5 transposase DNA-binding domain
MVLPKPVFNLTTPSTVSKILRQKEKYLNPTPKEESTSPVKRSKVKFPDIERALVNWVRNEQKKGVAITDEKLKKQARFFATTSPSSESQMQVTSSAWLEKFKQKNQIHTGPRKGKASISVSTDDVVIVDSSTTSVSEMPLDESPTSSVGLVSPPISPEDDTSRGAIKAERSDDFFDYDGKDPYDDPNSLEHVLSSDLDHSGSLLSPISQELIRASSATIEASPAYSGSNFSRQRSQTFPMAESEAGSTSRPPSSGGNTPGVPIRSITNTIDTRPTSVNPMHTVKRHKSVSDIHETEVIHYSSMKPPPLPKSLDNSPISPGSPTPEEAKQALHILKNFFQAQQTDVVDEDDYIMIGKLMGKLKQLKLMRRPSDADRLPGGMHSLDMFDSPRLSKKRTILGIST